MVDSCEDRLIRVPWTIDYGEAYSVFKRWWSRPNRPRAVYFWDDALCDVVIHAILELGIKVPEDLAVLTFANRGKEFRFPTPLTSIGFDPVEAAGAGCDMLRRLVSGQGVDQPVVRLFPTIRDGDSL